MSTEDPPMLLRRPPRLTPEKHVSTLTVKQAAGRLREMDATQAGNNAPDLFLAATGGYGKDKQKQLIEDIRELYAYVLGEKAHRWPFGDDAA